MYKFRGKRVDTKEWVYGDLIQYPKQSFINPTWSKPYSDNGENIGEFELIEVDPKTVGMFTGLKDKNDKPIYEGDIVNYKHPYSDSQIVAVEYIIEKAGYYPLYCFNSSFEIIGTIHDNKGGKNEKES